MWFEVALITTIFAVGNILFGHFEEGTPKWRRLLKFLLFIVITILLTTTVGRLWFYVMLASLTVAVLIIHGWWLPKQGINGWTAEPKEKYYELRGWKLPKQGRHALRSYIDTTPAED
jgi:hypothetical protein